MKVRLLIITSLFIFSSSIFAALEQRNYMGKNKSGKIHLILKEAPGRTGSFLGMLLAPSEKMRLYLIDEIQQNKYAMIPLEITSDGEIGIINDNPSLELSTYDEDGKTTVNIRSANSGNNTGFTDTMTMKESDKYIRWVDLQEGKYKYRSQKDSLIISGLDDIEGVASVQSQLRGPRFAGSHIIKSKLPGMYLLYADMLTRTGQRMSIVPDRIGVFITTKSFFGSKKTTFVLVKPERDRDLLEFKKQ